MPVKLGGGGGGSVFPQLCIMSSRTWVPPMDGKICIHLVGAGGGGNGGTGYGGTSGGAGGYCKKNSLEVTTSGSFTLVVGRGGYGGTMNSYHDAHMVQYGIAGVTTVVRNGGSTTMAGTGLTATLSAYGGVCGYYNVVDTGNSHHGGGGGAANGDVNRTGGAGNSLGGGAVGIYANGNPGYSGQSGSMGGGLSDAAGGGLELSGYGEIVGGPYAGTVKYSESSSAGGGGGSNINPATGSALNGGGFSYSGSNTNSIGGNGGLGGGGGAGQSGTNIERGQGGRGGNGFILIQYLPW